MDGKEMMEFYCLFRKSRFRLWMVIGIGVGGFIKDWLQLMEMEKASLVWRKVTLWIWRYGMWIGVLDDMSFCGFCFNGILLIMGRCRLNFLYTNFR